jgi:tyrosyl-tRNA synthetase
MSIPDSLILDYFELVTDVSDEELEEFRQGLSDETINPMLLKKRLADEIVKQLYSEEEADVATKHFERVVQKKEVPEEIELGTKSGSILQDYLVENKMAKSKSEARRLIEQGAVYINGERVTDIYFTFPKDTIIRVGKRRFLKST